MSKLFMLIGIPGSGKSTAAQKLSEIYNAPIYSSDDIRKELYGDASVQDNPKKVFDILHKRIIEGLNKYSNVIYDATNIYSKYRKEFLESLPIDDARYNICIVLAERPDVCIKRQSLRERQVPEEVIRKMADRLQFPIYDEGWDEIYTYYHNGDESSLYGWELKEVSLLDYITYNKNWKEELQKPPFCLNIRQKDDLYIFKYQQLNSDFNYRVVRESRGCILEIKDGIPEYVCRPFTKFFNVQEELADPIDWTSARVTEKIDGSLMKMFYYDGQWNLATNGTINAFEAEVSDTPYTFGEIFERALKEDIQTFGNKYLEKDCTYMFELTSPDTRVVISYPDGIYYLTRKKTATGEEDFTPQTFSENIQFPKVYNLNKLYEIIQVVKMMSKDEEGVVVNDIFSHRVKVKNPAYLDIAKMVGNHRLSDSTLYEDYICTNKADDLIATAPEYKDRVNKLIEGRKIVIIAFENAWEAVKEKSDLSQKDFALLVKDSKYSGFIFKRRKFEDLTAEKYFNELPRSKQLDYIKDSINDLEDEV